jgi:hypothetical protein
LTEKRWFKECVESGIRVHRHMGEQFVIYKGFKIIKATNRYATADVRKSDFYSPISVKDWTMLTTFGFIKGADMISNNRNEDRVAYYDALIDRLKYMLKTYKAGLKSVSNNFYSKKIRNTELKIEKSQTLLALYKTKVAQFLNN